MKILTWNCNGALRNKFESLLEFNVDIYVIQECENPNETKHLAYKKWAENYLWIGDNKNKGLGVFAKKNIKLDRLNWSDNFKDHKVKHFLPCKVNDSFNLLGVWTHSNKSPTFGYIGQLWKYLQINILQFERILIIGDLNSNKVWDKWDRWWNHSDVVEELNQIGVNSLYHKFFKERQGEETIPTFYMHRNLEKAYHIDYIFGSLDFQNRLQDIKITNRTKWLSLSDHVPIVCKFNSKYT